MCRALGACRQGYYQWLKRPPSNRETRRQLVLSEIKKIMTETKYRYGSRRVHEQLKLNGILCSRKVVASLMSKNGIFPKRVKRFKRTTDSNHNLRISKNRLKRKFTVSRPNQVWISDISYIRTTNGWLYLCIWMDLYSRKIVGWSIANHMRASLVCDALSDALRRRPGARPLVHSDRGSQYASKEFRRLLWHHKIKKQSMSRKGNCWDNAPAESFFSTIKQELDVVHLRSATILKQDVFEYIEVFYNRRRLHSTNGYKTPEEMENSYWSRKAAS